MSGPAEVLNDGCSCCASETTYRVVSKRQRRDGVWVLKVLAAESRYGKTYFKVWPEEKARLARMSGTGP